MCPTSRVKYRGLHYVPHLNICEYMLSLLQRPASLPTPGACLREELARPSAQRVHLFLKVDQVASGRGRTCPLNTTILRCGGRLSVWRGKCMRCSEVATDVGPLGWLIARPSLSSGWIGQPCRFWFVDEGGVWLARESSWSHLCEKGWEPGLVPGQSF